VCSGLAQAAFPDLAAGRGVPSSGAGLQADAVAVAHARPRKIRSGPTKRRVVYKVGFSSHTVFSSQAIKSSRSATTS
jgi:hypothetical protein